MTEAIKQWIADEEYKHNSIGNPHGFAAGLEKGIEIAEGFAEWKSKIGAMQRITGMWIYPNANKIYTTSELLEKYLEYLSSINKEK